MTGERWYVGVLLGGTSSEHDVSVNSGLNVVDALAERGHRVEPVYLAPDGHWFFDHRPEPPSLERQPRDDRDPERRSLAPERRPDVGVLERLADTGYDAVFVALHGPGGEDGVMQGLLRLGGVAFTGSDVMASALAMDKERAKRLVAAGGVPVAPSITVGRGADDPATPARVAEIGVPCVVKPVAGGSSFGTRIVTRPDDVLDAVGEARRLDARVLVERFVPGTEVTCGVLGGGPWEAAVALPLTEIEPVGEGFFDFRAKYTVGACNEITPARLPPGAADEIRGLALAAHELLGCEGMSRSDFIVGDEGPCYLETNTVPGMTRTSLLPQGAAAADISFGDLVERLVRSAMRRARGEAATRGT